MNDNKPTVPHCTRETMRAALATAEEIRKNAIAEARRNYTRESHTAIRTLHRQVSAHAQNHLDKAVTATPSYDGAMVEYANNYTDTIAELTLLYRDATNAANEAHTTRTAQIRKMRNDSVAAYGN